MEGAQAQANLDHEAIARRAYELFCQRGFEHGHDVQDWLNAEQELASLLRQIPVVAVVASQEPAQGPVVNPA
jgi:hypothetical protein